MRIAAIYDIHGNLPALEAVLRDVRVAAVDQIVVRVVNAGSIGMAFGEPGAYWLLLGSSVELCRTLYDLPAAADRIRATDYPQAEEFASGNVLHPPSEAQMLAVLEQSALR